jgi:O-antigen/teichoic acid export membrane protein
MPQARIAPKWPLIRKATSRLSWGIADQGMSSLSNFAVNIFIAKELGAVPYGAFSIAYVTYGFTLNASRGLGTDPLLVRFSGVDDRVWRRAVSNCTGTAAVVGVITGVGVLLTAFLLRGDVREAFLALGLTLPGLLLQDSWRFCFFAAGRGAQALLNDTIWTVVVVPSLVVLKLTHHVSVFWFLLAWGLSATVAAAIGALQSRVLPQPSGMLRWLKTHSDLGLRYMLEGTTNSAANQIRNYSVSLLLGLAVVGYVQGVSTLMGPFLVVFYGMGLVAIPEAARLLRRSRRHFVLFCAGVSGGLAVAAALWIGALLVAMPLGLGQAMLGSLWHPIYPLIVPQGIAILGGCISTGAGTGLHALGASKRGLGAMFNMSVLYVVCTVAGARLGGAVGTMDGAAVAGLIGGAIFWWQLRKALRDHRKGSTATQLLGGGRGGKHRKRFQPELHAVPATERDSA